MQPDGIRRLAVVATSNGPDDERRLSLSDFMGIQVTGALEKLGLQTTRVNDATGERTLNAVKDALQSIPDGDTAALVVYIGGHGEFTGADVRILTARDSDISLAGLLDYVERSQAAVEEVVVFLDACNSGNGVEIAERVSVFWNRLNRNRRLVLIPSAPPGDIAYERVFSDALVTAINVLARPNKYLVHISPRQLLNVIAKVNPDLSRLTQFNDASIEDARYLALPNPPWNRAVAWAQAEESDPSWSYVDRPLLRGDIVEALAPAMGGSTSLMGPAGAGKSTILRWIARTDQPSAGVERTIYIDCRGKLLSQIQQQLRDELDLDPSVSDDAPSFARSISGRSIRAVLDEVDDSPLMDTFVRSLVEIGGAHIVIAHSQQTGIRGRRIDLADERYALESRNAQLDLALRVLSSANLSEDVGFLENLVDAAGESFLMVYLLASIGANELPPDARTGTGIADALAGVFLRGVLDRLADVGLRPTDYEGRVRQVLLALAVAEGDGMPSAELWADVAKVPALATDPQLRDQLVESVGPLIETVRTVGPGGETNHSWRLQPTAAVAAFRSRADRVQSDFADRLLEELRRPTEHRDSRIASYAESHLTEHLRRAQRLSTLAELPSLLASLDRSSLTQSLALDRDDVAQGLYAIVRATGDGDLLTAFTLLGGGFGLAALAERSRKEAAIPFSAEWTQAPPNSHIFAAAGALVVGADAAEVNATPPPLAGGFAPVALFGRGILSFCAGGAGRAWMSAHDGAVACTTITLNGLSDPQLIVQMPGAVHALFERDGVLTASSAGYVVCMRSDGSGIPDVLPYAAVVGAVAFELGDVAIVTATQLIWRRDGRDDPRPVPKGRRAFIRMDSAGEWVFASTDDGSVWAWVRTDPERLVPIVARGGVIHFSALRMDDRVFVVVAMARDQVQVLEVSAAPRIRWSFEFPLDISAIALLSEDECAISTGRGVLRVRYAEASREEDR